MNKKWKRRLLKLVQEDREEMERLRQGLVQRAAEIRDLREQQRRNDITIRGVLMPFVNDLANGVHDGTATFTLTRDDLDVTEWSGAPVRVTGLTEWHAKYESSSGVWEDGEITERRTWRK